MLHQLGVKEDTLNPQEKEFLDEHGYLNLGQMLDHQQLEAIRGHLQEILESEGENAGAELLDSKHIRHPKEEGVDRLADLVNKGPLLDMFYTHPRLLLCTLNISYSLSLALCWRLLITPAMCGAEPQAEHPSEPSERHDGFVSCLCIPRYDERL